MLTETLLLVLVFAGIFSAGLLGLGFAAYMRRRSGSYLLVLLALGTLTARTLVGGGAMFDLLPGGHHHILEHALDIAMAALVIAALYYARTVTPESRETR